MNDVRYLGVVEGVDGKYKVWLKNHVVYYKKIYCRVWLLRTLDISCAIYVIIWLAGRWI